MPLPQPGAHHCPSWFSKGLSGIPASIVQLVLITANSVGREPDNGWGLRIVFWLPLLQLTEPSHQFSPHPRAGGPCVIWMRGPDHRASSGPGSSKYNTPAGFCQMREGLGRQGCGDPGWRVRKAEFWSHLSSTLTLAMLITSLISQVGDDIYIMNHQTCAQTSNLIKDLHFIHSHCTPFKTFKRTQRTPPCVQRDGGETRWT